MLLIDRKLTKLENNAEYASLLKLTKLVKKLSNLTRIRKKKPHCPISYLLACFVEPVRRSRFCFVEGLAGLTDNLTMGGAELKGEEVAIGFFG